MLMLTLAAVKPKDKYGVQKFYSQLFEETSSNQGVLQKKVHLLGNLRLAVFLATIVLLWLNWPSTGLFITILTVGVISFLVLLRINQRAEFKSNFYKAKMRVLEEELSRLTKNHEGFDEGLEFINPDHSYSQDLDLFGRGGIFQFISRCHTAEGRRRLADWLLSPASKQEILDRQEAVRELSEKPDWRLNLFSFARLNKEKGNEISDLSQWLNESVFFQQYAFFRIARFVFPAIAITLWLLVFFMLPSLIAVAFSLFQIGLIASYNKYINRHHNLISNKLSMLSRYGNMLIHFENETWASPKLKQLQKAVQQGESSAGNTLKELGSIVAALDSRFNLLSAVITNGLFMRDLQTMMRMEKWKGEHGDQLLKWLNVLAEIEVLASFGVLHFNEPDFAFPKLKNGPISIAAEELGHPLISERKRVGNNLQIDGEGKLVLITGSNMAGKSTFLRSVGVNIILAQAGATVCARSFQVSPIELYTSMRVGDSIRDEESTFYAELKKLKGIIEALQKKPVFILLDEILRGTNSADKLRGSEAFIRQVIAKGGSGLIATHDVALARLESDLPGQVINANFEADIRDGGFSFDYKLKAGVCQTMNATLLMKQMGIAVDEV